MPHVRVTLHHSCRRMIDRIDHRLPKALHHEPIQIFRAKSPSRQDGAPGRNAATDLRESMVRKIDVESGFAAITTLLAAWRETDFLKTLEKPPYRV